MADCPHEYLNSIKLFETTKKENAHKNKPANIKSNDFERTSDEVHFSSLETSYSTRPRCPRECLYTNIKNDAFNESFDEDKLRRNPSGNWLISKTLYQNNLNNIAFFFQFFKGYRYNLLSVITPKTISHGSKRK